MRVLLSVTLLAAALTSSPHTCSAGDRLKGCIGTYGRPKLLANKHADVQKLLVELEDIHANMFHWAIHAYTNEWDEFQSFLPLAREKHIQVWVTVMPPSESPPRLTAYSEPYRLDYERWATEIAKLSVQHTNLVAWSIDDFTHNLKVFTPEYLAKMRAATKKINPRLLFVPCCYYSAITPRFAESYKPLLDGILFPYRDESGGANLKNPDHVAAEINHIRELVGEKMPVILDVYATAHSRLGATTPEYVEKVVSDGLNSADGVLIYKHQDPDSDAAKYQIVRRLFREHRQ